MKRNTKRAAAFLALLIGTLAMLAASGIFLFTRRNAEGISFAQQQGDASVLNGVCISGILEDSFHSVGFASQGQSITHRALRQTMLEQETVYTPSVTYYHEPLPGVEVERRACAAGEQVELDGGNTVISSTEPSICETAQGFALYLTDFCATQNYAYRVPTQVSYRGRLSTLFVESSNGEKGEILASTAAWTNNERCSLVQVGERCYAITVTDAFCRGTGGIYDVTGLVDKYSWSAGESRLYERENLYPVELRGGEVQILSMQACGEKLALFIQVDGGLTLRIVTPGSWRTEQIIALPGWTEGNIADLRYGSAHFMCKGRYAVLSVLQDAAPPEEEAGLQCDVIDLERGMVVEQLLSMPPSPEGGQRPLSLQDALYMDGTLYLLSLAHRDYGNPLDELDPRAQTAFFPCLSVYRDGELVFFCTVRSGQQEDLRAMTPVCREYTQLKLEERREAL